MFRTKKEVERHVLDVLSKIDNENEKLLRGYTFARLFFQVKDYDTAKKYLNGFLSIRVHHAASHKLMAQIYEATNDPENSLQSYKKSLEIDSHQNDIVLKICELYCQIPVDHETARYWADRAEQLYPHNETVFKLREYLVSAEGEPDRQELENLIATELAAQPKNIDLRIKLLRLYLDTERVKQAYDHATMIESKKLFPNSLDWYYLLGDIFEAYQEECDTAQDSQFYINYLTALDHLIFLTLAEPHIYVANSQKKSPSLNDAAAVFLMFDQLLKKALKVETNDASWNYFIHHMKGQLYFHMVSILLKRAKLDQGNHKEAIRFCSGLALVCYTFKPSNLLQEIWFMQMENNQKTFTNFFQQGTLRATFLGHVLLHLCKDDKSSWLQKIKTEVCIPQVKERIYCRILSSLFQKDLLSSSYFIDESTFEEGSLGLPTEIVLKEFNKSAYKLCAASLHHLVWLELHGERLNSTHDNIAELFKNLQFSSKNLSKGSCESVCVLDLEAFLYATVYESKIFMQKKSNILNSKPDNFLTYPPDIADSLCSSVQATWWKSAHGLCNSTTKEKLGEHRHILQQGLEVIRGIGNHGMEVQLVIHIAQSFSHKAERFDKNLDESDRNKNKVVSNKVSALYARASFYWNIALGMLEKLSSGVTLNTPKDPVFAGSGAILSKQQIKDYLEEGKLYLAVRLMDAEKLNEAGDLLSKLSSPYASFYLAQTLMKLASFETRYSKARIALLKKAQSSVHDTMDRIRDDSSHPLNKELYIVLEDIENELAHESSLNHDNSSEDADETDAYDDSPVRNHSFSLRNNTSASHSTPRPSSKFMSSVSMKSKSETPKQHFQPSPERLDAQIRALTLNQDTLMKSFLMQQEKLLETNKTIVEALNKNKEAVEELKKQLEELRVSGDTKRNVSRVIPKRPVYLRGQGDEEDFYDPQSLLEGYEDGEDYRSLGYSFERPSRIVAEVPPNASAPLNYVMSPALPPGPPPPLNHYNYQYPHAVLPTPTPVVAERAQYYQPPSQGLPFSDGQQLPQFHFHVSTSVAKPSQPTLTSSLPSMMPGMPPVAVPPPQNSPPLVGSPWSTKIGQSAPHAFQIPLPPATSAFAIAASVSSAALTTTVASSAAGGTSKLRDLLQSTPVTKTTSFSQPVSSPAVSSSPSIFSRLAKTPETPKERSRCDSEKTNNSDADHDLEREVMGDFKPLIPLPDEIVVETGEEDETVFFEDRAKLYRFVDQEWKERGIGTVKILHQEESGRLRLLMRRDQVLKVCANHYITSSMEIHPMKNSDKAWIWCAQDFADEELRTEQFCIRFKTPEIALSFRDAFLKAIDISKDRDAVKFESPRAGLNAPSSPQKSFGEKFLPKAGSWNCPTCYVNNDKDDYLCMACETRKPGSEASPAVSKPAVSGTESKSPFQTAFSFKPSQPPISSNISAFSSDVSISNNANFGGFTFSSDPVIKEGETPTVKDREILVVSTKAKDSPQVTKVVTSKSSPFSGFSFQPKPSFSASPITSSSPLTQTVVSTPSSFSISNLQNCVNNITPSFVFEKNAINESKSPKSSSKAPDSLVIQVSSGGSRSVSVDNADSAPEEFVPTAEFEPVVPLPALVDVKTGEEDEEKIFGERAKLFRFDADAKEWKERGIGEMKILYLKKSNKYRILMRREQVLKLCANHYILPDMKLTPLNNSDKAWIWVAHDFSEEKMVEEKFAVKFKTKEIAQDFYKAFGKCLKQLVEASGKESNPPNPCSGNKNAFEQLLQPSANSWSCPKCLKSNMNQSSCVFCQTPRTEKSLTISSGSAEAVMKIKPEDTKFAMGKSTKTSSAAATSTIFSGQSDKPLSELFKPPTGSWECSSCYTRNGAEVDKCASCEAAKPGASGPSSVFGQFKIGASTAGSTAFGSGKSLFGTGTAISTASTTSSTFTNDSSKPLSELFKPPIGSWECKSCYVQNKPEALQCASCEAAKPGTAAAPSSVFGQFQFGTSTLGSTPAFGTGKSGEFVFGSKPAAPSSTFSFGLSSVSDNAKETSVFKPSVFGSTNSDSSAASTFAFGSFFGKTDSSSFGFSSKQSTDKDESTNLLSKDPAQNVFSFGSSSSQNNSGFTFGSPQKYEFNFSGVRPRSPTKTPKSPRSPEAPSDVDEEESFDADNIYFQPVIPLPPKVEVKTGEENEKTLYSQRAKLFRFCDKEWKERGIGDIKILSDEANKKIRLLMRREQVLKVCLNHYLAPEIKFEKKNDKTVTWGAMDYSENEPSDEIFALRFKTSELADEFLAAVSDALKQLEEKESAVDVKKAAAAFSFKTDPVSKEVSFTAGSLLSRFADAQDSNAAKPFSFSLDNKAASSAFFQDPKVASSSTDADKEIEIVYEFKPDLTPEQENLVKTLLLPRTFFLYLNKPPCPGCIGCEDFIPPYADPSNKEVVKDQTAHVSEATTESAETPMFNLKNVLGFGDVSSDGGFSFGQSTSSGKGFEGAGTPLFAKLNTSTEDDNAEVENADIHFEPIIPLPELVDVKTGEEDEAPVFSERSKLFKYDPVKKEWKERGVGDLKILKHKEKMRFRILLRRDQVYKIACNHCIEPKIELSPLNTSATAVCWNALDFSEGNGEPSQFAARFKNKELLEKFKEVFCQCRDLLINAQNKPATQEADKNASQSELPAAKVEEPSKSAITQGSSQAPPVIHSHDSAPKVVPDYSDSASESSVEGQDDQEPTGSESEELVIFEKRCTFEIGEANDAKLEKAGMGTLHIVHDEEVDAYRVQLMSGVEEDFFLGNHYIVMESMVDKEGKKKASWQALDLAVDPPRHRKFRVTFNSPDALKEFVARFNEGVELAKESEIHERSDSENSPSGF